LYFCVVEKRPDFELSPANQKRMNSCMDALKTTTSKLKSRQITVGDFKFLKTRQDQLLNIGCIRDSLAISQTEVGNFLAQRNGELCSYKNFLKQVGELLKTSASFLRS